MILDNYITHNVPVIKKWLAGHPRFHLHFTPTGSSWLNLVERWFAELMQKKLKRGVHRSVPALEHDIRAWLSDWNEHPRPFVWTKTADELLDRITVTGEESPTQVTSASWCGTLGPGRDRTPRPGHTRPPVSAVPRVDLAVVTECQRRGAEITCILASMRIEEVLHRAQG